MLQSFYKSPNRDFTLLQGDCVEFLNQFDFKFDMIFADPPYALENLKDIPDAAMPLLADGGLMILEHGKNYDFKDNPYYVDHRTYGSVNFTFFIKQTDSIKPLEETKVKDDVNI